MYNIFYKYKSTFFLLLKVLIVGGAYYIISEKMKSNNFLQNEEVVLLVEKGIFKNPTLLFYFFLFTFLNWYFEVLKWKTLVSSISSITIYEALKQSLFSLTASLLTPNRIGEYGAKALYFKKSMRVKIMFLSFLGNFNQMLVTTFFGFIGLVFLIETIPFTLDVSYIKWTGFIVFLLVLSFLGSNKIVRDYWYKLIAYFKIVPYRLHFRIYLYSFLRYLIFSHQFYFFLLIFGVDLDYSVAMTLIFTMYFFASIIPTFVVFDWLIKGSIAVTLFSVFHINEMIVLSVTSLMWLANFALPTTIGSFYVLTFKNTEMEILERNVISS